MRCPKLFSLLGFVGLLMGGIFMGTGFLGAQEDSPEVLTDLAHQVEVQLLVPDPRATLDELIRWIEAQGGYYTFRSRDALYYRLPNEKLPAWTLFLEEYPRGELISLTTRSEQVGEQIRRNRSGIAARQEVLDRNLAFMDKADVGGTLAIENEVSRLLLEIEQMKGQLRRLESESRFAVGRIQLSFRSTSLPQKIPSSFDWINGLGLYRFLEETE